MTNAVEIGVGYYTLVPSAKGSAKALAKEVGGPDLDRAAAAAGDSAGDQFSSGFGAKAKLGMLAVGGLLAAGLASGLGDALGQDKVTDKLAASLTLSDDQAALAGSVTGQLYADAYGESFEGVSEQLGLNLRNVASDLTEMEQLGLTAGSIDVTRAYDIDPERLAQTTGLVLKSGLAESALEAQDVVTAALQGINAPAADVLDTLYEFNEPLASLGLTGADSIALLSAAADAGVFDLTKAGDAVKELSIRAIDGSAATSEAYKVLGLNGDLTAQALASGGFAAKRASGQIIESLLAIEDPLAQDAAGVALFGTTWEDLGPKAIGALNPMKLAVDDVTGTTAALGDTLNDNLSTRIEALKRRGFQELANIAERFLIPALESVVGWIENGGETVARLTGFLKENQPVLIGVGAGLGVVALALGVHAVQSGIAAAANFTFAGSMLAAALPVIAVAAAIGLLVAGLIWAYQNVETFRVVVDAVASFMQDKAWPVIKTGADLIGQYLVTQISLAVSGVKGLIEVGKLLASVVKREFDRVADAFRLVGRIGNEARDTVNNALDSVVDTVTGLPGRITRGARGLFDGLLAPAKSVFNSIGGLWNRSIGAIGFDVPDWVPKLGGRSFSVPNIPVLHNGGVVPGQRGSDVLALVQGGEGVVDLNSMDSLASQGRPPMNVTAHVADARGFLDAINRQAALAA